MADPTARPCRHATHDEPVCLRCVANRMRAAAWYAANKGRALARMLRWGRSHKRKRRAICRRYWHRRPASVRQAAAMRAAALRGARPTEPVDPIRVWLIAKGRCWLCGWGIPYPTTPDPDHAERFTLDHVVPCSKGGAHSYRNVRAAHAGCNARRGAPEIPCTEHGEPVDSAPF